MEESFECSGSGFEARPPEFPRPSSSLSKTRLVDRMSFGAHKKDSKSPWTLHIEGQQEKPVIGSAAWLSTDESVHSSDDSLVQSLDTTGFTITTGNTSSKKMHISMRGKRVVLHKSFKHKNVT